MARFIAVSSASFVTMLLLVSGHIPALAFAPPKTLCVSLRMSFPTTSLSMGLYDTPLPPRPSPQDDDPPNNGDSNEDEDFIEPAMMQRLFSFNMDGTEKRNFLPPLKRSLDLGIDCYFEASDRKVRNLVSKTDCHPEDAAWALEACRGDVTEAWTRISTARRQLLQQGDPIQPGSLEADYSSLLAREELDDFRAKLKEQERKRRVADYFSGGQRDEKWLPQENPKPIDDEPWFTG